MRIHTGPGCQIYYVQQGDMVHVFLTDGDNSFQGGKDITKACELWQAIKERR